MIPDKKFIMKHAMEHGHTPDRHLLRWLEIRFSDEIWPGQYDEMLLDSLIDLYCTSYDRQPEAFRFPTPYEFYREQYMNAKEAILLLLSDRDDQIPPSLPGKWAETAYSMTCMPSPHACQEKENARILFLLWEYLSSEGLQDDAREYLLEHEDDDPPFTVPF